MALRMLMYKPVRRGIVFCRRGTPLAPSLLPHERYEHSQLLRGVTCSWGMLEGQFNCHTYSLASTSLLRVLVSPSCASVHVPRLTSLKYSAEQDGTPRVKKIKKMRHDFISFVLRESTKSKDKKSLSCRRGG